MIENTKGQLVLGATSNHILLAEMETILNTCLVLSTQVKDCIPSDPVTQHVHILTKRHIQEH